jgi:hypothetical protein
MAKAIRRILVWGSQMAFGLFILSAANNIFDWAIYPFVMCTLGVVSGGIVLALASIPFNYILIRLYDWFGKDMMGIEALKEFEDGASDSWFKRVLQQLTGTSRHGRFLFISIYDPIPATLYMRDGTNTFHGLKGRDWIWFSVSTIIANLFWMALMALGIVAVEAATGACAI